jgi:phosphoribosylanthranilate isomerase
MLCSVQAKRVNCLNPIFKAKFMTVNVALKHRTRVKICGVTNIDDALCAANAGADAIGLNFYPKSKRVISLGDAVRIQHKLPAFFSTVAVFVNAENSDVQTVANALKPALLQFHGDETPQYCEALSLKTGIPYLKAVSVGVDTNLLQYAVAYSSAVALLLDTAVVGEYGGSGQRFDWNLIPESMRSKIILSGGLRVENVAQAVQQVKPWAVDVASGVEAIGSLKGIKDHVLIQRFVKAATSSLVTTVATTQAATASVASTKAATAFVATIEAATNGQL